MAMLPLPVPHLQQRQPGDCLAACAAMALDYLGCPAKYDHLLKLLKIKPTIGTPAYNIRHLQPLGVDVLYEQGSLALLETHLRNNHPCIAMVQTRELPYWHRLENSHAVVVTGLESLPLTTTSHPPLSPAPHTPTNCPCTDHCQPARP